MAEKQDKIFVDGVFAKKRDNAPSFVVTSISIKVPDLIPFLNKHQNNAGYVNFDVLLSQNGTQYCQLNTWQPTPKAEVKTEPKVEDHTAIDPDTGVDLNAEDIPF